MDLPDARPLSRGAGTSAGRTDPPAAGSRRADRPPAGRPTFESGHEQQQEPTAAPSPLALPPFSDR